MPVVTTLHTVLREPRPEQRRVMQELISLSTRLVVMAERGRRMLQEVYDAPPAKIDLIAARDSGRAVSSTPPTSRISSTWREGSCCSPSACSLRTRASSMCSTLCPRILAEFPDVVYIVLGATHPNELRDHGEAYRLSLEILAKKNKVEKNVIFYNRFVELENLKEFIGAADLYVTPYLNEAQITSGTLAYTFGAGKAVVSTPYWHAAELLADGRGVLGAIRRRPGHRPRGDRVAAGRHEAPRHAKERLQARPRHDLEQRRAALHALVRVIAAGGGCALAKITGHQDARPEAAGAARAEARIISRG